MNRKSRLTISLALLAGPAIWIWLPTALVIVNMIVAVLVALLFATNAVIRKINRRVSCWCPKSFQCPSWPNLCTECANRIATCPEHRSQFPVARALPRR